MVMSVCQNEQCKHLSGGLPALRRSSFFGSTNLPRFYDRTRNEDQIKLPKNSYFKKMYGNISAPGEVPGLRKYDNCLKRKIQTNENKKSAGKKLESIVEPMPRWLPELFSTRICPFSKDFPTNLLLSKEQFWPSQPLKSSVYCNKGLKWPKVKHMVVKHPKFIESSPTIKETLWSLRTSNKERFRVRRGRCQTGNTIDLLFHYHIYHVFSNIFAITKLAMTQTIPLFNESIQLALPRVRIINSLCRKR